MGRSPKAQSKEPPKDFPLKVSPTREALDKSIEAGGKCDPKNCWHKLAVDDRIEQLEPGARHLVHIDAGHARLRYRGWRYIADQPRHVKRSILLFDKERYDLLRVQRYTLHFRRTTKVIPIPRARQDQINKARRERIAAGGNEYRRSYPSMRKRVEGFALQ